MNLFEHQLQRAWFKTIDRYERLRAKHRPRKKAKRKMQRACHKLLREECRG